MRIKVGWKVGPTKLAKKTVPQLWIGMWIQTVASIAAFQVLGLAVVADAKPPSHSDRICIENLHRIYGLIEDDLHLSAGLLPFPSLGRLYGAAKDPKPFICPADTGLEGMDRKGSIRSSYEIVTNPLDPKYSSTPPNILAIVVEKRANHSGKRFVLFNDGSVREFSNNQFDKLRSDAFIDLASVRRER
jgi:hypothetical protein